MGIVWLKKAGGLFPDVPNQVKPLEGHNIQQKSRSFPDTAERSGLRQLALPVPNKDQ